MVISNSCVYAYTVDNGIIKSQFKGNENNT